MISPRLVSIASRTSQPIGVNSGRCGVKAPQLFYFRFHLSIVAARNVLHTDGVDLEFTFKKSKES